MKAGHLQRHAPLGMYVGQTTVLPHHYRSKKETKKADLSPGCHNISCRWYHADRLQPDMRLENELQWSPSITHEQNCAYHPAISSPHDHAIIYMRI